MFTKKMAVAAALSLGVAAAGLSTSVFGQSSATEKKFVINVTATIPAIELEIKHEQKIADSQSIALEWDVEKEIFKVHTSKLSLKSNIGAITAALQEEAEIKKENETIPLKVTFNDVQLTKTKQQVLAADKANLLNGTELVLTIVPMNPEERKSAGKYEGTVTLVFEAGAI